MNNQEPQQGQPQYQQPQYQQPQYQQPQQPQYQQPQYQQPQQPQYQQPQYQQPQQPQYQQPQQPQYQQPQGQPQYQQPQYQQPQQPQQPQYQQSQQPYPPMTQNTAQAGDGAFDKIYPEGKSRGVAALLAILLGVLGVHYFYIGKNVAGFVFLGIWAVSTAVWMLIALLTYGVGFMFPSFSWVTWLFTVIQGIVMFTMSNEKFAQKYLRTPSNFPLF